MLQARRRFPNRQALVPGGTSQGKFALRLLRGLRKYPILLLRATRKAASPMPIHLVFFPVVLRALVPAMQGYGFLVSGLDPIFLKTPL
jgi:hypothetical protein